MAYEVLFDHLWETRKMKQDERNHQNMSIDEGALKDDNFFQPKNINIKYRERFSRILKKILINGNADYDILQMLSDCEGAPMKYKDLFESLTTVAHQKDKEIENLYKPSLDSESGLHYTLLNDEHVNYKLLKAINIEFNDIRSCLFLQDDVNSSLLEYLKENMRWITPRNYVRKIEIKRC